MTNILVIGDIVRTETGLDMVIGFTPENKIVLKTNGISDEEFFNVIGNYDDIEGKLTIHKP